MFVTLWLLTVTSDYILLFLYLSRITNVKIILVFPRSTKYTITSTSVSKQHNVVITLLHNRESFTNHVLWVRTYIQQIHVYNQPPGVWITLLTVYKICYVHNTWFILKIQSDVMFVFISVQSFQNIYQYLLYQSVFNFWTFLINVTPLGFFFIITHKILHLLNKKKTEKIGFP